MAQSTKQRKHSDKLKQAGLDSWNDIDYKDVERLRQYIMETGRILPRRITKVRALHQRKLALAIRRARHLALIEFCDQH